MAEFAPILVTAFNRPERLEELLTSISDLGTRIYVALDAAKIGDQVNIEKVERCKTVIRRFETRITETRIAEHNQGCYLGVSSAIDWAFGLEEVLIILEDDIRFDSKFVNFATDMLEIYRDEIEVSGISSMNLVPTEMQSDPQNAYRFSMFTSSWGWATWRNRWVDFVHSMEPFEGSITDWPNNYWDFWRVRYWTNIFDAVRAGEGDSWAYRWQYTNWLHRRLTIVPNANLSLNRGYAENATHTKDQRPPWWLPNEILDLQEYQMHPLPVVRDSKADSRMEEIHYRMKPMQQVRNLARRRFPRMVGNIRRYFPLKPDKT